MNKKLKAFITVYVMGAAYAIIYALPFIQYVFYDPLIEGLKATNAQLGILIAIFGIGNLIAPFGGFLVDKFNHKNIYLISLLATAGLCFAFALNLNYTFAIFVWVGLAISALFAFFPAHIKIVRSLADEKSQGTIFGLSESAAGVGSVIVNTLALYMFTRYTENVAGLKSAIIGYGLAAVVVTIVLYFLLEKPEKNVESTSEKINFSDFKEVLKYPGTWFAGIAVFATYTLYVTLSYFTPYFTSVLGVTVVFSGGVAIVRTYLLRFIGAPLGGIIGDKLSVSKVVGLSLGAAALIILTFMNLPVGTSVGVLIFLTLLISLFTYISRGNMFAVSSEVKSPEKYAATTAGVVCAIGYSPDLFQFTLFGNWLDKYGNAGYNYIFIYTMVVLAIGVVNAILTVRYVKKKEKEELKDLEVALK